MFMLDIKWHLVKIHIQKQMLNKGSTARSVTMSGFVYTKVTTLVYKCILYLPEWHWVGLFQQLWSPSALLPVLSSHRCVLLL